MRVNRALSDNLILDENFFDNYSILFDRLIKIYAVKVRNPRLPQCALKSHFYQIYLARAFVCALRKRNRNVLLVLSHPSGVH